MPWENGYILGDNFLFTTLCLSSFLKCAKDSWTFFAFFGQVGKTAIPCQGVYCCFTESSPSHKKLDPSVCVQTALPVLANLAQRYLSTVFDIANA